MTLWISDPKDGKPSVSLTLLVVSFAAALIVGALQVVGRVSSTGMFPEMMYSTTALYFGRRISLNGKTYDGGGSGT